VKKIFPWKFNLEYGSTFTKLFMHVSSRNMFPTTRNLQIRVHVYQPRHYCGDWLTFGCSVPMIADHNLVKKSFGPMIADHDLVSCCVNQIFFAIILMWYTRNIHVCIFLFINWTLRTSDNLPERVQIMRHAHIICITVLENYLLSNILWFALKICFWADF
jgi:hypothetical protein